MQHWLYCKSFTATLEHYFPVQPSHSLIKSLPLHTGKGVARGFCGAHDPPPPLNKPFLGKRLSRGVEVTLPSGDTEWPDSTSEKLLHLCHSHVTHQSYQAKYFSTSECILMTNPGISSFLKIGLFGLILPRAVKHQVLKFAPLFSDLNRPCRVGDLHERPFPPISPTKQNFVSKLPLLLEDL